MGALMIAAVSFGVAAALAFKWYATLTTTVSTIVARSMVYVRVFQQWYKAEHWYSSITKAQYPGKGLRIVQQARQRLLFITRYKLCQAILIHYVAFSLVDA